MPLICTNRAERLTARFPAEVSQEVTMLALLWGAAKAALADATGEPLPEALLAFDALLADATTPAEEGDSVAEIYYHRLTNAEMEELVEANSERGVLHNQRYWLQVCQRAVDAWNNQVLDVDLNPIPVPTQRDRIAAIVANFPEHVLPVLATLARTHMPEEIKKNYMARYPGISRLRTSTHAGSLPVGTVANGTMAAPGSAPPAIPEG